VQQHPQGMDIEEIDCMDRDQLIGFLQEQNKSSTFRFTRAWLKRQGTQRLRDLVRASREFRAAAPSAKQREDVPAKAYTKTGQGSAQLQNA